MCGQFAGLRVEASEVCIRGFGNLLTPPWLLLYLYLPEAH